MNNELSGDMVLMAIWNGWWQGIVLTAVVWLVLRDLPRIAAATRLAIWQLTLAVAVTLPLLQRVPMFWAQPAKPAAATPMGITASVSAALPSAAPSTPVLAADRPLIEIADDEVPGMLLAVGGFLAVTQLLRLFAGYLWLRRVKKRATPSGIGLPGFMTRATQVRLSDQVGMPLSVGFWHPMILLPREMAGKLNSAEVDAIVMHEAGHLERHDDWAGLVERLVRAVFFFQPAVYWIGRELDREREMACDDWVLAQMGNAKEYAHALSRVAELASVERAPLLATGAGRRKEIFLRLEALFDQARNRAPRVSGVALFAAACGLGVLVSQSAPLNRLLGLSRFEHRMISKSEGRRLEIASRGELRFSRGNTDIEQMTPGGRFVLELEQDGRRQRVEMEADAEGKIQRAYIVDGVAERFAGEGQRFFAREVTPWVLSRGENIADNLNWLVADKGFDGALREVRSIPNSEARRRYLIEMLQSPGVDAAARAGIWRVAEQLDSDEEKRAFYLAAVRLQPEADAMPLAGSVHNDEIKLQLVEDFLSRGALTQALTLARTLDSDERRREAFAKAWRDVAGPAAQPAAIEAARRLAASIDNEEGRYRCLKIMVESDAPAAILKEPVFAVLDTLASNQKQHHALLGMLSRRDWTQDVVNEISRRALQIDGEEARRELREAVDKYAGGSSR